MKKSGHLLPMLLSFSLLFLLVGCVRSGTITPKLDPANPTYLDVWHYYNGPQKDAFDEAVLSFNSTVGAEIGITVEAFSLGDISSLTQKVLDAANKKVGAGTVPAIFATYADTAMELSDLDLLTDLTPYLTDKERAAYRPEFLQEGHLYGDERLQIFPIAKSVELMMINATDWQKFADATGAQLSVLGSIEGVTHTAKAYYDWSGGKAFFGRDAMANYLIIGAHQLGSDFLPTEEGTAPVLSRPNLHRIWENYYVPFVSGHFAANGRFRSDDTQLGDIITYVGSSSSATYFPKAVMVSDFESYPIDCIVQPAPLFEAALPLAVQQGAGMAVSKSTPETEYAATVFLKWFTEPARNVAFAVQTGYLPVTNAALSSELIGTELAKEPDPALRVRMEATYAAALKQIDSCTLYSSPPIKGGDEVRGLLTRCLNDASSTGRAEVLARVAAGETMESAVAQMTTDAQFNAFFDGLSAELSSIYEGKK